MDQVSEGCIRVCLDQKLDDIEACRNWCRDLISPAHDPNLTSADDAPDLRPSPPPPRHPSSHLTGRAEGNNDKKSDYVQEQFSHPNPHRWRASSRDVPNDFWNQIRKLLGQGKVISSPVMKTAQMASKRQVDPLLSCIEARCAGVGRTSYGNCIYSKCLAGWKRKRGPSTNLGRRYGDERRRESSARGREHADEMQEGWKESPITSERNGKLNEERDRDRGYVDEDDRLTRIKAKRYGEETTGTRYHGQGEKGLWEHVRPGEWKMTTNLHYQSNFADKPNTRFSINSNTGYRKRDIYGSRNNNTEKRSRYDNQKRSWNDVMQTCIEYKCRHTAPGTFDYNVCIQQACSKHMFGKR